MSVRQADELAIWRYDYYTLHLKLEPPEAQWFTMMEVSPHDLEDLLKRGCPLPEAKRILCPI